MTQLRVFKSEVIALFPNQYIYVILTRIDKQCSSTCTSWNTKQPRSMSSWLTFSLRYIAKLYQHHNEEQYSALKSSHFTFSEHNNDKLAKKCKQSLITCKPNDVSKHLFRLKQNLHNLSVFLKNLYYQNYTSK